VDKTNFLKNTFSQKLSGPALAGLLLTLAPVLFSSALTYFTVANEAQIAAFGAEAWLLLTLACCLTSAVALTPPTFLALVFGYFLGWLALLPLFALNMGAIFLVCVLVRAFDNNRFVGYLEQNPKARAVLHQIRERELPVIFFTKLSPVLPFAVTNLVFALSGARLTTILLGGFLGMVPRTALAVWTGFQAKEIRVLLEDPNQDTTSQVVVAVLVLVSVGGLIAVLKPILTKFRQTEAGSGQQPSR